MKKIDYVDALRGLAITSVIMTHSLGDTQLPQIIRNVINSGARGVQLFFLASAFTLFLSFENRFEKEAFPIRNFFLRRFFRIAPMYYIGICYYLFQDGRGPRFWLGDAPYITNLNILSNITFLHGFNPYWITSLVPGGWSIGVEMAFYLLLPFLFSKIKHINQAFNFLTISLLLQLAFHLALKRIPLIRDHQLWEDYLFLYFPSQLPIFSLGIIMYFVVLKNESLAGITGKSLLLFSGVLLLDLATGAQLIFPKHIFFGIGFLLFGVALSRYHSSIFVNPVINYIGKISFSMYIVHFAVLHWLTAGNFTHLFHSPVLNYLGCFLLLMVITGIIASIFYNLVELPCQNIGKSLIKKMDYKAAYDKVNS